MAEHERLPYGGGSESLTETPCLPLSFVATSATNNLGEKRGKSLSKRVGREQAERGTGTVQRHEKATPVREGHMGLLTPCAYISPTVITVISKSRTIW